MSADDYPAGICPKCGVPRGGVLDVEEALRGLFAARCRVCDSILVVSGVLRA